MVRKKIKLTDVKAENDIIERKDIAQSDEIALSHQSAIRNFENRRKK